jgi:hypothetical protein
MCNHITNATFVSIFPVAQQVVGLGTILSNTAKSISAIWAVKKLELQLAIISGVNTHLT